MADKIYIMKSAIDEVEYTMNYLDTNLDEYDLNELTNGRCPEKPGIHEVHPLSMMFGEMVNGEGDYTSLLPSIGVELVPDSEFGTQKLGRGEAVFTISQDLIDELVAIPLRDRIRTGWPVSDTKLTAIQDALTDAVDNRDGKLYAKKIVDIHDQTLTVSIWADDISVKRLLYKTVRVILKRMRQQVSALGVKNMKVNGTDGFFNYEFDQTLFGAEFSVNWLQDVVSIEIDPNVRTLGDVELFNKIVPENQVRAGINPVPLGE